MSMNTTETTLHKLALLLAHGLAGDELHAAAVQIGVAPDEMPESIAAARQKLIEAASYNPDEELGRSVVRLHDLYRRAVQDGDSRTALVAQKEINRLLRLYDHSGATVESIEAAAAEPYVDQLNTIEDLLKDIHPPHENRTLIGRVQKAADLVAELRRVQAEVERLKRADWHMFAQLQEKARTTAA